MTGDQTQTLIDTYKRPDGVVDWYKVLDIPRTASAEQVEIAFRITSATFYPQKNSGDKEGAVRYVLAQKAFEELGDPARRKKYDAFCRFQHDHAMLLATIEAERQKQKIATTPQGIKKILHRADTKNKRLALLATPFLAITSIYFLAHDLDHYQWEPSLAFWLFSMASALCLAFALTNIEKWIAGSQT